MSNAIDREQQVIAHLVSVMFESDDCSKVMSLAHRLCVDDFSSKLCRLSFHHITTLCERNETFDLFEIGELVSKDERYHGEPEPTPYLMQWQKDLVGAKSTAQRAIKDVKRFSVKRQANNFIQAMQRRINEEETPYNAIQDALSYFETLQASQSNQSHTRHISEINQSVLSELNDRIEGKEVGKGLETGIESLDELLGRRGLAAGDLVVVAARPSMGKTSLAIKMMQNTSETRAGIIPFFSLEMTGESMSKRLMHNMTGKHFETIATLGREDADLVAMAVEYNSQTQRSNIYINDDSELGVHDLKYECKKLSSKGKIEAIFVDYLGLMKLPNESRHDLSVAKVTRQLKILAKEMSCPVILLSQLNRGVESRSNKRPNNADLRDSGAIEQDADIILFPYRDEVYNEYSPAKGYAEIIASKNREGQTGTAVAGWDKGRFTNCDIEHAMNLINQSKETGASYD